MRKFSRDQLREAAEEGDSFCLRCGELNFGHGEGETFPCEACGAEAVIPAQNILEVLSCLEGEE